MRTLAIMSHKIRVIPELASIKCIHNYKVDFQKGYNQQEAKFEHIVQFVKTWLEILNSLLLVANIVIMPLTINLVWIDSTQVIVQPCRSTLMQEFHFLCCTLVYYTDPTSMQYYWAISNEYNMLADP